MKKFMLMGRRRVLAPRYQSPRTTQVLAWLVLSALVLFGLAISTARSQAPADDWYMVRAVDAADLGLAHPVGLSYSPAANVFMALGRPDPGSPQTLITFTPFADPAGSNLLAAPVGDPLNVAFRPASETLLALESGGIMTRLLIGPRALRWPEGQNAGRAAVAGLRLNRPVGATVDTAGNRLFALDAAGPYLVEVRADHPDVESSLVAGTARIRRFRLGALGDATPRGLAYHSATGRLYTAAADGQTLFELSERGRVVNRYDLSEIGLVAPQGMVVAPSADPTDDPSVMNLYLADSGGDQNLGRIIEISFVPQVELPTALVVASLVNVIDTSKNAWNPSSPDPAGLAYRPSVNRLLVSDSEVEESHPDFQGYNVFQTTVGGSLSNFCTTVGFSNEPTGAAVNPANDHIFFTDDNANRVYDVDLVDGTYCNGKDVVTNIHDL